MNLNFINSLSLFSSDVIVSDRNTRDALSVLGNTVYCIYDGCIYDARCLQTEKNENNRSNEKNK